MHSTSAQHIQKNSDGFFELRQNRQRKLRQKLIYQFQINNEESEILLPNKFRLQQRKLNNAVSSKKSSQPSFLWQLNLFV